MSSCPRRRRRPTCSRAIAEFNDDPGVDAFIVQLPLPQGLDDQAALDAIDPAKDADGLHPVNLGRLMLGAPGPRPCTPLGIQALLVHNHVPIAGHHVVIVGRGLTIGRPLAVLLSLKEEHANATVTHCHTGTNFLPEYTTPGRHPHRRGRFAEHHPARHGEAGCRGRRRGHDHGGSPSRSRRRRGVRQRGGLDHAPSRRGRSDDPRHAAAQHR